MIADFAGRADRSPHSIFRSGSSSLRGHGRRRGHCKSAGAVFREHYPKLRLLLSRSEQCAGARVLSVDFGEAPWVHTDVAAGEPQEAIGLEFRAHVGEALNKEDQATLRRFSWPPFWQLATLGDDQRQNRCLDKGGRRPQCQSTLVVAGLDVGLV